MNLLYTTVGRYDASQAQRNISQWRTRHQIVEFMPEECLASYLRFEPSSTLALIDAIVCSADGVPVYVPLGSGAPEYNYSLYDAIALSWAVRDLPESCAMRDGRKWRSIPFIIFRSVFDHERATLAQGDTHARIIFVPDRPHIHSLIMLNQIGRIVDEYQDRVLDDYKLCGILVRFEYGHAQISPALRKRDPSVESEYYYAAADRRNHSGWVTFKRDRQGLRRDVETFRQLLDTNATEREMHKFFEQHPEFLMQARLGIPISHAPTFAEPKGWTPDFAISPILGPLTSEVELLELKGPSDKTLTRGLHPGFSAKVKRAIDQVKDYDRYLRNPANHPAILKAIGYIPEKSNLAVLIGRDPTSKSDKETSKRRQNEIDVEVITYDEILAAQASQLKSFW